MKFLLVTEDYPPFKGGVSHYYYNLFLNFPYEHDLVILNNNKCEINSKNNLPLSWFKAIFAIIRKLKKQDFDLMLAGQILPYGTAMYIISLFKKIPYGVFLHGMDFPLAIGKKRKKILAKKILKRSEIIVCANSYLAKLVEKVFPEFKDKIVVVNPGLPEIDTRGSDMDSKKISESYNFDNKTILFSLGRLVKRKGFDKTIEAIASLDDKEKENLVYVIAGAGPDEAYLRSLVSTSDRERIIFLGQITEGEKWSWLNKCDIFVMPSRNISGDHEGFGIVYLEANLCSKPVIAGLAGGVGDAVVDNETGLMVDPENIESIKDAILKLKDNSELRDSLGEKGKERVKKEFSWQNLAIDLVEFIKMKI
ncbi:MAG: glycosyltransferase family 4 protein [Patescibacteria group bacterium]|jgi:phosphatidylinositol alpha-1,6-mannosyltransferase|nr:glycosyltransferase family 4 protein [Patescibacteria group bacterium]